MSMARAVRSQQIYASTLERFAACSSSDPGGIPPPPPPPPPPAAPPPPPLASGRVYTAVPGRAGPIAGPMACPPGGTGNGGLTARGRFSTAFPANCADPAPAWASIGDCRYCAPISLGAVSLAASRVADSAAVSAAIDESKPPESPLASSSSSSSSPYCDSPLRRPGDAAAGPGTALCPGTKPDDDELVVSSSSECSLK